MPLDPDYPAERLAFMVEDAQATVVLTHRAVQERLPASSAVVLRLDEVETWADLPDTRPVRRASPQDLAYVIYTSGSTGRPKGCLMTHANISRLFSATEAWFHFGSRDTWTLFHSYAFDFSVWEIWGALAHGGRLVIVPYLVSRSPDLFRQLLLDERVTVLNQTPSAFLQLIQADAVGVAEPFALKWIIFGGEALEPASLRPWFERHGDVQPRLVNMYGITETTVHVTYHALDRHSVTQGSSVIGRAIPDLRIYLLDRNGQPVPPGVEGEMHVAGAGLARGYLRRPELTAEKFIEVEVLGREERLYRTGDLARWGSDGNLEYLGRLDHQVKLRGFRIELGEVEAALSAHEAVSAAAVVVREREGSRSLAGYVVLREAVEPAELKTWVKARLPEYMVPASVTVLEALPLTPNGKVDRRALPEHGINSSDESNKLPPRDAIELRLLQLWREVLKNEDLSIHSNFFEVGGHSLAAFRLTNFIAQEFFVRLPVGLLFKHNTIASLATQIRSRAVPKPVYCLLMNRAQSGVPLFLLPGAIGSVLYLSALATALGNGQPIYALQTPGLEDNEATPATVEALAAYHLRAVRQVQTHGPYRLAGHSSGGPVAFEMANQLEGIGETVSWLGILDTQAPDGSWRSSESDDSDEHWLATLAEVFEELSGQSLGITKTGLQALGSREAAFTVVLKTFQQHELVFAPEAPIKALEKWVATYKATRLSHRRYRAGNSLACPVSLFCAQSSGGYTDAQESAVDRNSDRGWGKLTRGGVEVIAVPGGHVSMMANPHVKVLARAIAERLPEHADQSLKTMPSLSPGNQLAHFHHGGEAAHSLAQTTIQCNQRYDGIILNGTSSSGKSSIVNEILTQSGIPFVTLDFEVFLGMIGQQHMRGESNYMFLKALDRLVDGFHRSIEAMIETGNIVLVEHVVHDERWHASLNDLYRSKSLLRIEVTCSVEELRRREKQRGNRIIGTSERHLSTVHLGQTYDLSFDTTETSPSACARLILDRFAGH